MFRQHLFNNTDSHNLFPASPADTSDLPKFAWTDCPIDTSGDGINWQYDKCLEVDFPLDQSDDTILLNYVNGETTVLKGHLKDDPDVHVSVTIEGSILEVYAWYI